MISHRQFAANIGRLGLALDGANKRVRRAQKGEWQRAVLRDFVSAVREVRNAFGNAFDGYRPELHYMRGPGPKFNAKRSNGVTTGAPAAYSLRARA